MATMSMMKMRMREWGVASVAEMREQTVAFMAETREWRVAVTVVTGLKTNQNS